MPEVQILYFARSRDITGRSSEQLTLPDSITTESVLSLLESRYPGLSELRGRMLVAHNQSYLEGEVSVGQGDEIALIPPVSGG